VKGGTNQSLQVQKQEKKDKASILKKQVMDTLIAATVVIGDRSYRIKIQPTDEEVVRKTVKTINDKIIEFKTQFAGKDMQDYIAMVLVWFATEQGAAGDDAVQQDNISERLNVLEKLLDQKTIEQ
jgi:hypothetical protein